MKSGELFRKKRMEKGISISQAAKDLYLQEKYLKALEDDNYDIIAGETYQRAYFKKYASYLGLSELFERAAQSEDANMNNNLNESDTIFCGTWDPPRYGRIIGKLGGIVIIILLIVFGVRARNAEPPAVDEPDRVSGTQTLEVIPSDTTPSWTVPTNLPADPGANQLGELAHELIIRSSGENWITVRTRDGDLFNNFMYSGDELTYNDYIGFYLNAGRPERLEVIFDGEPVEFGEGEDTLYLPPSFVLDPPEDDQNNDSGVAQPVDPADGNSGNTD